MADWAGTRCRVQVTLPMTSGISADSASNTWYIANDGNVPVTPTYQAAFDAAFQQFYKDLGGGGSQDVDWAHIGIKYVDMDGPKPQYPFWTNVLNCTPTFPPATAAPAEVAICLSYHAPYTPGIRHARRNGRVYLGPLAANNVNTNRPAHAAASVFIASGNALRDAIAAVNPSYMLAQHSTKSTQLNGPLTFWVDNAYDVQRRRGLRSTVKWLS